MGLPGWRTVFDKVERAIGAPLEDAVASPRYGTAVTFWVKGPAALNRAVRRSVDDKLASVLHLLNVPAHEDVQKLSRQLAVLTAEVRALSLPADRISSFVQGLQEREPVEAPPRRVIGSIEGA
jgi:hypothetical protein